MGTHLRVLGKSFLMNTNMTGFRKFCVLVLWTKVASAFEGFINPLMPSQLIGKGFLFYQHLRTKTIYLPAHETPELGDLLESVP